MRPSNRQRLTRRTTSVALFENAWPVNSGVLQTTGSIRFVSPGPDFHPGNYEDNEHLVVFPNAAVSILKEAIRVDMVDPGQYARSRYREKRTLPAGRRVTSYLLQFDALSSGQSPGQKQNVRGQITFAHPIVGVVTETRLLKVRGRLWESGCAITQPRGRSSPDLKAMSVRDSTV